MDYKKKYEESIERAKLAIKECGNNKGRISMIESIFPEFLENEDEKIRKEIIAVFKGQISFTSEETVKKYIAWLEKQGKRDERYKYLEKLLEADTIYQMAMNDAMVEEAKTKAKEAIGNMAIFDLLEPENQSNNNNQNWKPSKEQIHALEFFVRSIGESGYASPYDNNTKLLKSLINDLYKLLENQSGQEPADKIVPKFKVGDWVVFDNNLNGNSIYQYHIEKIENYHYTLRHILGGSLPLPFGNESHIRPWTLDDAKDGDVLDANGAPFIYKKHNKDYVYFYCGVNLADAFIEATENDIWNSNTKVYPATKEQRDLLFQKMKESGYQWDAKKKELKKINSYCQEHCKGYQETGKCFADGGCDAYHKAEQESVESPRDYHDIDHHFGISVEDLMSKKNSADKVEPIFSIGDVLCDKSCTTLNKKYQPIIEILDIRNGMYICNNCSFPISQQYEYELVTKKNEPQYAWSDEDEENLNKVIGVIERREMTSTVEQYKDILHEYIYWLKSLKGRVLPQPKTTWSSNDEYITRELGNILYNAYGISDDEREMCNNWLNTIKSRVHFYGWSEEDIRNIQDIDSVLFYDKDLPEETCMRLRNWLEFLKPNKEMIEALRTEYEKGRADAINEMKPRWSKEDELNHKYALAACIYYGESKGYDNTKDHQEALVWLKSLKERIGGK